MDETTDKPKGYPCPVCQQRLVPQYNPDDPHTGKFAMRSGAQPGRYYVPMRCTRCGINLEISVSEQDLMEPEDG